MPVYFIRNQNGNVKIGHSVNPAKRLMLLQTGTAESLRIVRTIEGDDATERWLHRHFASDRIRGEWFNFREEMLTIWPPELPPSARPKAVPIEKGKVVSPREIIGSWKQISPSAHVEAFAGDIGVRTLTAHAWVRRKRIPSRHWDRILEAAIKRGFPMTWQNLSGKAELVQQGEAA